MPPDVLFQIFVHPGAQHAAATATGPGSGSIHELLPPGRLHGHGSDARWLWLPRDTAGSPHFAPEVARAAGDSVLHPAELSEISLTMLLLKQLVIDVMGHTLWDVMGHMLRGLLLILRAEPSHAWHPRQNLHAYF